MNHNSVGTRRRSPLPWLLLGLVVATIAGVTLYRHFHSEARPDEAGAASPDAATGRIAVRNLSPEQLRAMASRAPGQSGPATAADMAGMMERRKRMVDATQARNRDRNTAMTTRFSAEKNDPAWSGAHEKELASLLDSGPMLDAGVKVEGFQAECRSTMCRIQAGFPNQSMASDWLQLYMASVGDRLPVATAHQIRNPDGSVQVEIYGVGRKR